MKENKKVNKTFQWRWFWGTIFVLFLIYAVILFKAMKNMKKHQTLIPQQQQQEFFGESLLKKIAGKTPEIFNIASKIDEKSKIEVRNLIIEKVDKLYEPVYNNLDNFVNLHYSLKGEYSELLKMATDQFEKYIYEHIFLPAHFDENYKIMIKEINEGTKIILKNNYKELKNELEKKLKLSNKESSFLLDKMLNYSEDDMIKRFENNYYASFRTMGVLGGMSAAVLSKLLAKKLAQKLLIKAGIKTTTKVAATAAGAAAGAESGLVCGTFAIFCSPVAGFVGGVIGWFGSDKIVLEVDKYVNQDKFKQNLIKMIDKQKQITINSLIKLYFEQLDKLNQVVNGSIEKLKTKKITQIIKDKK